MSFSELFRANFLDLKENGIPLVTVFHIYLTDIDGASLWATEEIQGLCFHSQLFRCQENPFFPCLLGSKVKLFCIKWGKLSLSFETTGNVSPFM